eukprot:9477439-Pyramimonas_sp.AAC.1
MALSDLVAFLDASGIASFSIPGVKMNGGDEWVPADISAAYLKMMTNIKDLTAIAAVTRHNMFVKFKGGEKTKDEDVVAIFGSSVHAQCLLAKALVRIDAMMASKRCICWDARAALVQFPFNPPLQLEAAETDGGGRHGGRCRMQGDRARLERRHGPAGGRAQRNAGGNAAQRPGAARGLAQHRPQTLAVAFEGGRADGADPVSPAERHHRGE